MHGEDRRASDTAAVPPQRTVMQWENERGPMVVSAKRTDNGSRCSLVLVRETGGSWAVYPHGAGQLGVRLSPEAAAGGHDVLDVLRSRDPAWQSVAVCCS
ncbi:MAG: hypothetical protein ACRDSL_24665 [Pseudonocardiaceae bacterium]